ncbi:MAG TPA: hypothetical protein VIJ92_09295 [Ginsengibacter sp.]
MSLAEKKQTLLYMIEDADEKLTGLLIALASEYNDADQDYSKEELDFFNNRRKAFYENNKRGYSTEEAHNIVRRNYKNGL